MNVWKVWGFWVEPTHRSNQHWQSGCLQPFTYTFNLISWILQTEGAAVLCLWHQSLAHCPHVLSKASWTWSFATAFYSEGRPNPCGSEERPLFGASHSHRASRIFPVRLWLGVFIPLGVSNGRAAVLYMYYIILLWPTKNDAWKHERRIGPNGIGWIFSAVL